MWSAFRHAWNEWYYGPRQEGVNQTAFAVDAMLEAGGLREEFIVCHAAGYPDPHSPWPNTLENAQRFADEHRLSGVTGEPVEPQPVVKRRLVSLWEAIERG